VNVVNLFVVDFMVSVPLRLISATMAAHSRKQCACHRLLAETFAIALDRDLRRLFATTRWGHKMRRSSAIYRLVPSRLDLPGCGGLYPRANGGEARARLPLSRGLGHEGRHGGPVPRGRPSEVS